MYLIDRPGDSGESSFQYPKGALVGWLIVQPIVAVAAWHLWKRPRPAFQPFALAPAPVRKPTHEPAARGPAPAALSIPLVWATF
jgi:hypothetical protein